MTGLALHERAALIGVTAREYLDIAHRDSRIVGAAAVATPHAVRRLRAWFAAGMPDVAADAIVFRGDDAVRAIVIATLASLPAPVRWHAVRRVLFFEIGRGDASGWFSAVRLTPAADDAQHVIAIDGRTPDLALPSLICHELGHALHAAPPQTAPAPTTRLDEYDARLVAAHDGDCDAAARWLLSAERLANDAARLWGHPCDEHHRPLDQRLTGFRRRMAAASERAAEIKHQIDTEIEADLAAGIVTSEGTHR